MKSSANRHFQNKRLIVDWFTTPFDAIFFHTSSLTSDWTFDKCCQLRLLKYPARNFSTKERFFFSFNHFDSLPFIINHANFQISKVNIVSQCNVKIVKMNEIIEVALKIALGTTILNSCNIFVLNIIYVIFWLFLSVFGIFLLSTYFPF